MPDPDRSDFDAVAAAKELDDLLGESATGSRREGYVDTLEAEIEELTAALASRDAEVMAANQRADQAHKQLAAASARIAAASAKELAQRTRKLLESFLPVVDDLDRAIAAAKAHASSLDVAEGLELVRRRVLTQLGQFGVTHVPARGEKFDPRLHEAMVLVPVTDASQDGYVIDVMREGYAILEDTLRPAGVAVGKLSR